MTTTGLGGLTQPEVDHRFYDLDRPDAETIANISHKQRSLAAGSRVVADVLDQHTSNDQDTLSFSQKNELVESLHSVYGVYPEVFTHGGFFSSKETVDEEVLLKRLPDILEYGGLPVLYHDFGSFLGKPEDYDQRADQMDEVALALMSNMPSKDFLRDYDIKDSFGTPSVEELVKRVVGLLDSEKYFLEEAERYERHYSVGLAKINLGRIDTDQPKLELYISFISSTKVMMKEEDKEAFNEEYIAACNNPQETTVVDVIEALAERSIEVLVNRYKSQAVEKREAFDMVMSGQAASYTSPK